MCVHVYTSPHLVRFAERIRIAGKLVTDDALADTLTEVERVNADAAKEALAEPLTEAEEKKLSELSDFNFDDI